MMKLLQKLCIMLPFGRLSPTVCSCLCNPFSFPLDGRGTKLSVMSCIEQNYNCCLTYCDWDDLCDSDTHAHTEPTQLPFARHRKFSFNKQKEGDIVGSQNPTGCCLGTTGPPQWESILIRAAEAEHGAQHVAWGAEFPSPSPPGRSSLLFEYTVRLLCFT